MKAGSFALQVMRRRLSTGKIRPRDGWCLWRGNFRNSHRSAV